MPTIYLQPLLAEGAFLYFSDFLFYMQKPYYLLLLLLLLMGQSLTSWAQEAVPVTGSVLTDAGQPLPGATIFIKGTFIGTSTSRDGGFELRTDFSNGPVVLSVSFVGYVTQELTLSKPDNGIKVTLKPNPIQAAEVIASASRKEENILQAPVTVEKVTSEQVLRLPPPDVQGA